MSENPLIFAHAHERERGFFETGERERERERALPVSVSEMSVKFSLILTRKISIKMDLFFYKFYHFCHSRDEVFEK